MEEERRRQEALLEKEKVWYITVLLDDIVAVFISLKQGNVLFKEGKLELAVECYTVAMELDPLSAVMPANRALALLKLER